MICNSIMRHNTMGQNVHWEESIDTISKTRVIILSIMDGNNQKLVTNEPLEFEK